MRRSLWLSFRSNTVSGVWAGHKRGQQLGMRDRGLRVGQESGRSPSSRFTRTELAKRMEVPECSSPAHPAYERQERPSLVRSTPQSPNVAGSTAIRLGLRTGIAVDARFHTRVTDERQDGNSVGSSPSSFFPVSGPSCVQFDVARVPKVETTCSSMRRKDRIR